MRGFALSKRDPGGIEVRDGTELKRDKVGEFRKSDDDHHLHDLLVTESIYAQVVNVWRVIRRLLAKASKALRVIGVAVEA